MSQARSNGRRSLWTDTFALQPLTEENSCGTPHSTGTHCTHGTQASHDFPVNLMEFRAWDPDAPKAKSGNNQGRIATLKEAPIDAEEDASPDCALKEKSYNSQPIREITPPKSSSSPFDLALTSLMNKSGVPTSSTRTTLSVEVLGSTPDKNAETDLSPNEQNENANPILAPSSLRNQVNPFSSPSSAWRAQRQAAGMSTSFSTQAGYKETISKLPTGTFKESKLFEVEEAELMKQRDESTYPDIISSSTREEWKVFEEEEEEPIEESEERNSDQGSTIFKEDKVKSSELFQDHEEELTKERRELMQVFEDHLDLFEPVQKPTTKKTRDYPSKIKEERPTILEAGTFSVEVVQEAPIKNEVEESNDCSIEITEEMLSNRNIEESDDCPIEYFEDMIAKADEKESNDYLLTVTEEISNENEPKQSNDCVIDRFEKDETPPNEVPIETGETEVSIENDLKESSKHFSSADTEANPIDDKGGESNDNPIENTEETLIADEDKNLNGAPVDKAVEVVDLTHLMDPQDESAGPTPSLDEQLSAILEGEPPTSLASAPTTPNSLASAATPRSQGSVTPSVQSQLSYGTSNQSYTTTGTRMTMFSMPVGIGFGPMSPRSYVSSSTMPVGMGRVKSKRLPTIPQGPKFALDQKYGEKINERKIAGEGDPFVNSLRSPSPPPRDPSSRRRHSGQHSCPGTPVSSGKKKKRSKRKTTVPQAPKFALDAKYGAKKNVSKITGEADSFVSSLRSSSPSSSKKKRSITIPRGPSFELDEKYGEKTLTPTTDTSNYESYSRSLRSPASTGTPTGCRLPTSPWSERGPTVPLEPKFHQMSPRVTKGSASPRVTQASERRELDLIQQILDACSDLSPTKERTQNQGTGGPEDDQKVRGTEDPPSGSDTAQSGTKCDPLEDSIPHAGSKEVETATRTKVDDDISVLLMSKEELELESDRYVQNVLAARPREFSFKHSDLFSRPRRTHTTQAKQVAVARALRKENGDSISLSYPEKKKVDQSISTDEDVQPSKETNAQQSNEMNEQPSNDMDEQPSNEITTTRSSRLRLLATKKALEDAEGEPKPFKARRMPEQFRTTRTRTPQKKPDDEIKPAFRARKMPSFNGKLEIRQTSATRWISKSRTARSSDLSRGRASLPGRVEREEPESFEEKLGNKNALRESPTLTRPARASLPGRLKDETQKAKSGYLQRESKIPHSNITYRKNTSRSSRLSDAPQPELIADSSPFNNDDIEDVVREVTELLNAPSRSRLSDITRPARTSVLGRNRDVPKEGSQPSLVPNSGSKDPSPSRVSQQEKVQRRSFVEPEDSPLEETRRGRSSLPFRLGQKESPQQHKDTSFHRRSSGARKSLPAPSPSRYGDSKNETGSNYAFRARPLPESTYTRSSGTHSALGSSRRNLFDRDRSGSGRHRLSYGS